MRFSALSLALFFVGFSPVIADDVMAPVDERFGRAEVDETPDFQKHVVPTLTRLGCNARACHGSFQGRGGFQLSLFGYDFKADHDALLAAGDERRVDIENPTDSLILNKPTDADMHEGGKRYDKGGWQHHLLLQWIKSGAKYEDGHIIKLTRLEVMPAELLFSKQGETVELQAVAVWEDGTREDVTPICRFESNDEQVAQVDENGKVTCGEPGDTHVVVYYDNGITPVPTVRPITDKFGPDYPPVSARTTIDKHVVTKLSKLGVLPSEICTDAEFLRRVCLDMTGTLPTPNDVEAFLADKSPDKRLAKINALLETPAYAAWWTTRLCDQTGNNDQALNNVTPDRNQATQQWYDWIYRRVEQNVPYDALVAGIVLGASRRPGQSYTDYCAEMSAIYRGAAEQQFADRETLSYYWARRTFRQPEERAIGFAHAFLGIRIQCAQCHKHPFDQWSKSDFDEFKGFFTRVNTSNTGTRQDRDEYEAILAKLNLDKDLRGGQLRRKLSEMVKDGATIPFPEVYVETPRPTGKDRPGKNANRRNRNNRGADKATLLGGQQVNLNEFDDARRPLLDWLRRKDNPYLARAFVNRVWAAYFNVGIVEPPDNLSLANPPSNKPLLDYLTQGFIEHGYDMKWLHREIASSDTYQRSWRPNASNRLDEKNFSRALPRRLPAEVAYDAVRQATAADDEIAAMQADMSDRSIALPGSSSRNQQNYALTIFGRSVRENNCDCDRSSDSSLLQTVYLQNDQEVFSLLADRKTSWIGQVAPSLKGKSAPKAQSEVRRRGTEQLKQNIATLEKRLQQARKTQRDEAIQKLEPRLADLRQRLKQLDARNKSAPATADLTVDEVIRRTYLRSLSRMPTDEELARSRAFIESNDDPVEGVSGLLWALINTKEFIVNH